MSPALIQPRGRRTTSLDEAAEFAPQRRAGGHRTWKCQTCRERKVKCDTQEPFCATCTSGGHICKGYLASDAFIHVEPGISHSRRSSRTSNACIAQPNRSQPPMAIPFSISTWTPDPAWNCREFFLLHLVGNGSRSLGSGFPSLMCEFLDKPLPVGSAQYMCMRALTTSYYLMRTAGPDACCQAMITYSSAIKAVQAAIDQSCGTVESDIFMSIMCLCLYENIIVTMPRSWIRHYEGISRMIEMHGPDHYRTGRNRDILMAFRYTIVISAGTLRHHCFLAEPAWRQIIELNEAESHDAFGTVLNIAVDVPGLLHGGDHMNEQRLSTWELYTLSMTLQRTMLALERWWYTFFPSLSPNNDSSYSPYVASAMGFYLMVLLLLEKLCFNLNVPWLPASTLLPENPAALNEAPTMAVCAQRRHVVASEILHLAQQSIGPDTGIYDILRFIMPLHVAYDHLLPGSPQTEALNNLMHTVMAGQHGFQMARRYKGQYTSVNGLSDDEHSLD